MKKILVCFFCILVVACFVSDGQSRLQKKYDELVRSFPTRFDVDYPSDIFIKSKEYIFHYCAGSSLDGRGMGLGIIDLSKLPMKEKVKELEFRLKYHTSKNMNPNANHLYLNKYIRKAIYNYDTYGEEFLLIEPFGSKNIQRIDMPLIF